MGTYFPFLETGCLLMFFLGASAFIGEDIMNRIIGGSEIIEHYGRQIPYQLALEGAPYRRHTCGGSVLATYWAITAAHCVYNKPVKSLAFRAGSTVRGEGGSIHPVSFYLYHDLYREKTLDYDLALVKVKEPFRFGKTVQPVTLPRSPPQQREYATVSGWGFLEKEQLRKPKNLMAAEVTVSSWENCKKVYPSLTPRMMCAGAKDIDFCQGDSGGPLIRDNREQIGVVSWLYKCGDGLPGVYANISSMMPWIEKSLRKYGVYLNPEYSMELAYGTDFEPGDVIMFPSN